MTLLLNKDNQRDDLYMRKEKKTIDDKKLTMGLNTVTTLGEKIMTTLRHVERRKPCIPIFSIEHHLQSTIIERSLFTGMEANRRDNPLKRATSRSLEVLREDFNDELDHKRNSTGTPIFATPPVRAQDHTYARRPNVSAPCRACTGLLLQEQQLYPPPTHGKSSTVRRAIVPTWTGNRL